MAEKEGEAVYASSGRNPMLNAGDKEKPPAPKQVDSRQLLGRNRELYILHNNERYILRITANNKLILTK